MSEKQPSSVKKILKSLLKGTVFEQKEVAKHAPFATYIFAWVLIVIYFSGSADQKIYEIKNKKDKRREVKSEHVELRTQLMSQTKPSQVIKEVEVLGLEHSFEAPKNVYIDYEE